VYETNNNNRSACVMLLYVGLGAIEFWARAGLEDKYLRDKARVLKILEA